MSVPPPGSWPTPRSAGPAPLNQPQYDATIGQAVSRFWRKFAMFSGRASRSEYWWWTLVSFCVSIVLQLVGSLVFWRSLFPGVSSSPLDLDLRAFLLALVPSLVWSLVVLVPSVALAVRRLHDTNRSGWWYLLGVPSLVGLPFYLVGLFSFDPRRVAVGDFSGLAVGPLVTGVVLMLFGAIGAIILLIFFVQGPDPRGARFDRRVSPRHQAR